MLFFKIGGCPLAPVVAPFEIEVVRVGALRVTFGEPRALFARERQAQVLDNLSRDLVLDVEQIHAAPVEAVTPQLRVLPHVDELGLHVQRDLRAAAPSR